jgi:hypothetical protein
LQGNIQVSVNPDWFYKSRCYQKLVSHSPRLENLIMDSVRQAKADLPLVLHARTKTLLWYWRSMAWWQGLSMLMAL